jgi:NAD(P)H-flavin reductase
MPGVQLKCEVIENLALTPTVTALRFRPRRRLRFDAGQFCSVIVPAGFDPGPSPQAVGAGFVSAMNKYPLARSIRRIYSFASPPEADALELCVKHVPGGAGSSYIASLQPGSELEIAAPFGDFCYRPNPDRGVCFISTGTGIAPFRSIALSRHFQDNLPPWATVIQGARSPDELCYPGLFERLEGVDTVCAVSDAPEGFPGFRGRVTDYLRSLPLHWRWRTTDFYLCGNPAMVEEVHNLLTHGRGVPASSIVQEAYFGVGDWGKASQLTG